MQSCPSHWASWWRSWKQPSRNDHFVKESATRPQPSRGPSPPGTGLLSSVRSPPAKVRIASELSAACRYATTSAVAGIPSTLGERVAVEHRQPDDRLRGGPAG